MTPVDISVLLVTHNHAAYIVRALASIESQISTSSLEVVVADDASTDGTREAIVAWAARVDIPVRILPEEARLGITRNYERGFRSCTGRYVAVLEGDDEWLSVEKLELQARHLDEHPDIVVVASRFLLHDQESGESCPRPLIGTEEFWTRITSEQLAESNWFGTFSTCMYRASALARISPEIFAATSFDWMINLAVTEFGDAALLPEVTALYRIHPGGTWSGMGDAARAAQLRSLIPTYMALLGGRLDRQLSRVLSDVDEQVRAAGPERPTRPAQPPGSAEPQPTIRLPRVASAVRPRVSVVMASYNHRRYVLEAIESVLAQTMPDLELVVVDDDSRDGSLAVIGRVRDERVRAYALRENTGGAAALNFAIQQARGEFVAVINSDDRWAPEKLARQLEVFERRPDLGAVFTGVQLIDERGRPLPPARIPAWAGVFRQPNRSQGQWLRFFLANGNALCHPSALLRRDTYRRIGLYDNTLRQLPDLDRWISLVKHAPIEVLGDEPLVHFRTFARHSNASGLSARNIVRTHHEHLAVNETFFRGVTTDLLVDGFADLLRSRDMETPVEFDSAVAFLWLDCVGSLQDVNRAQGLSDLRRLLRDPAGRLHLKTRYGFTDLSLHELTAHAEAGSTGRTPRSRRAARDAMARGERAGREPSTFRATLRGMRTTPLREWPMKIRRRITDRRWRPTPR